MQGGSSRFCKWETAQDKAPAIIRIILYYLTFANDSLYEICLGKTFLYHVANRMNSYSISSSLEKFFNSDE